MRILLRLILTFCMALIVGMSFSSIYNSFSEIDLGKTVTLTLQLNSEKINVNVLTVNINYPSDGLQVINVDTSQSVMKNLVEETVLPKGKLVLTRFMPPGESFSGNGEIAKITFKVLTLGEHIISIDNNSAVFSVQSIDILDLKGKANILGIDTSKTTDPIVKDSNTDLSDNIQKDLSDSGFINILNSLSSTKSNIYYGLVILIVLISLILLIIYIKRKRNQDIPIQIPNVDSVLPVIMFLFLTVSLILLGTTTVRAQTGSLAFDPSSKTIEANKSFTLTVMLNTGEDDINAANVTINYPADIIEFTGFNSGNSVLPNKLSESSTDNTIHIERYISTQFTGSGILTALTFKALVPGSATLTFDATSSLPTGYDTPADALSIRGSATVTVKEAGPIPNTALIDDIYTQKNLIIGFLLISFGFMLDRSMKKGTRKREEAILQ
jgi:hypothetical protein